MSHLGPDEVETADDANPHVKECAKCREAVRLARGRQKLLKGMRPYTLSDAGFRRVDARLQEHAHEARRPPLRWLPLGFVATVMVVLAMVAAPNVAKMLDIDANFSPMTVVFAQGETTLKAGDVLDRHSHVAANNAQVVLASDDGYSLRLSGGATFELGLRNAAVALESGNLVIDAKRGGRWVTRVGKHFIDTSDALMVVSPNTVDLARGSVLVFDEGMFQRRRTLTAPAHLDLDNGSVGPLTADLSALPPPVKPPWARLVLGLKSDDAALDGQKLGRSPLSTLTTPGRHHVSAAGREADVELTTSGSGVVELPEKTTVVAPVMPVGPHVEADPALIAKAIRAQLPKFRVCHDKWLKVDAEARGKVEMALTVSPQGKVVKTTFTAAEGVPPQIDDCLARAARTLVLPKSSEEVELELPVLLGGN